jgi:hypothetical protein
MFVAGLLMQGCSDKSMTDFSVRYESLALPVGESARIKVTFTPADADNVQLEWSSDNERVATVNNEGIVSFVGVGTAVITVNSGSISKTIRVEGLIRSLTVTAPEDLDLYEGAEFTLRILPDPVDAQVAVNWSSSNEAVATVSSAGNVQVLSNGTTVITAAVGPISGSYTVVCEDMLESALGYWEFDNPSDMLKPTKGRPLVRMGEGIRWVEGPSAENLAIEVPMHEYFIADLTNGTPNGGPEGQNDRVYYWSIMMDFRLPTVRGYYYVQHGGVSMGDGDFFVRYDQDQIRAGKGTYIPIIDGNPAEPYTPWIRMVITFEDCVMRMYCNGKEVAEDGGDYPLVQSLEPRYSLPTRSPLYIFSEPNGTTPEGLPNFAASDDDKPFPCAAIAFWDRTLNAGQVKALGGIEH